LAEADSRRHTATRYELIGNLKTVQPLGIKMSTILQVGTDDLIE
jgi:hypothetical protein